MEDVRVESGLRFADSDDLIFVNYPSSDDDQKEDEEEDDQSDSLEEVELGPGYRSILHPEHRSPELSSEPQTEDEEEGSESESDLDHSTSAGSSYDSSSDPSSQGSIKTESESKESACQSSDYQSASLKLKPLKITLSFDLTKPDPDIDGIVRKDRTNSTSYTSCNDHDDDDVTDDVITQISSDNSLDHFTDHSSASEFRGSPQEPGEYETSDVEAGGVKDRRKRGIGAGFVALWGLGRLWLNPSKSRRNYDAALEKKKLTDGDKNKATVAEIYPWIIEEESRVMKVLKEQKRSNRQTSTTDDDFAAVRMC